MLEKYFGFLKVQDEYSILDSLIEHCRIDEEELNLLSDMVMLLTQQKMSEVEEYFEKIRKISTDSSRIFENTAEHIIQANFDHQKQYDLLRLYQRIENISSLIISSARRILVFHQIGGLLPIEQNSCLNELMKNVLAIHIEFRLALTRFQEDKKMVLRTVSKVEELKNVIDDQRAICLENIYRLANDNQLPLGNFRAMETIVEHLEEVAAKIKDGATSLEWLLLT
ncbi:MAG: hypothetical protein ACI9BD_000321 [Candidatus Marinamargulisbacteria bacterium]|jgi:uncharacterized protein Yka (UPF0111/DUF47 family)